jgi:cellulose synthase/poly-beta-1,6-N-acetylglucosamine synthase-like glycosyltransferase
MDALNGQTVPVNVIVVDAHSADGTRLIVEKNGSILLDEPPSTVKGSRRAVALNEGLRHSAAEYVATVDADAVVPPGWAETLLRHLEANPDAAAVTGGSTASGVMNLFSAHGRSFATVTEVESVPGYSALYRRRAVDEAGGYREDMGGCEDWEMNRRIRLAGWRLLGVPGAAVEHRENQGLRSFTRQVYGYGWSRARQQRLTGVTSFRYAYPLLLFALLPTVPLRLILLGLALMVPLSLLKAGVARLPMFVLAWSAGYVAGWLT